MTHARAIVLLVVVLLVSACDGYVEQATVGADGSVSFEAQATISCDDELQRELWGPSPCERLDAAGRGGDMGALPLGFAFDSDRATLVVDGVQDRRRITTTWEGTADELSTPLLERVELRSIDDSVTELVAIPGQAPIVRFLGSPGVSERVADAGWPAAELRVVAPDVIVEHNADEINGRVVTWRFDRDRPETLEVRWTTEPPATRYWWWLVGGSILVAVLFMMVSLEGSAGRNDDGP